TKKRILITGANGLLGRYALAHFKDDYEVHAIVRNKPEETIKGVVYHTHDLKDNWSTESLPKKIDVIYHLAQSELFREFPNHALDVFNVNVTSTVKLLDYAKNAGAQKFIFTSTGGIYDRSLDAVSENSPINTFGTLGNYFATKLCSEILTHNYTNYFDVTLLRLFFMYGKGQKRSMLIPRLVDNVRLGNPIKLTRNGGIQINPVHVSDVVKVLEKLLETSGSFTFNVAGPQTLTLKEITEIIGEKMGKEIIYEYSDSLADNCIANIEMLNTSLYNPVIRISDIIEELF
ncbi:MAG: NAD(P)-dependent oxidoreductase, partial [Bacteroidetes bacterium]|nr:NAD(P)-dependent oxidoreductase [Bacteroidota bacterium]